MNIFRNIIRYIVLFLYFLTFANFFYSAGYASEISCPIFGLPQLGSFLKNITCQNALNLDSDNDGIKDWTNIVDGKQSPILIPLSQDMDGDGIPNIFDEYPLLAQKNIIKIKKNNDANTTLPMHLSHPKNFIDSISPKIEALQLKLYHKTGIIAVQYQQPQAEWQLEILLNILTNGIGLDKIKKIKKLKYFYTQAATNKNIAAKAFFINDMSAIVLTKTNSNNSDKYDFYEILSHEIGHAVAFSLLSAPSLYNWATQLGPWQHLFSNASSLDNFFNPILLRPHPAYNEPMEVLQNQDNIPSRYSLSNMHEWFAESFAAWVMQNLNEKGIIEKQQKFGLSSELKFKFDKLMQ